MAYYQFELGIDWGLYTISQGETGALQTGFASRDSSGTTGQPASAINLQPQDWVGFYIYDTTSGGPVTQTIDSMNVVIQNAWDAPVDGGIQFFAQQTPSFGQESQPSFTFDPGTTACWYTNFGAAIQDVSDGRYLMTITIKATKNDANSTSRSDAKSTIGTWKHDPEMIIGGTG